VLLLRHLIHHELIHQVLAKLFIEDWLAILGGQFELRMGQR